MEKRWENERSACRIITFQRVGHSLWREEDSGRKPDSAQREIETTRQFSE